MKNPISKAISDLEIILNDLPDENEFDELYTNIINKIDKIRKLSTTEIASKLVEFASQTIESIYSEKMKKELEEYIYNIEQEFHLVDISNNIEDSDVLETPTIISSHKTKNNVKDFNKFREIDITPNNNIDEVED